MARMVIGSAMGSPDRTKSMRADAQDDLAEDMPLREAPMRFRCLVEVEQFRYRDLQPRCLDGAAEAFELAHSRLAVVRLELQAAALLRCRLDAVRVRHSAPLAQRIEAARQGLAADEGEDRVDAVRREGASCRSDVLALAVDDGIGAQAAHERGAVGAR